MGVNYSGAYATPRLDLGIAFMEFMVTAEQFIATEVFPITPVDRREATFSKIRREDMLRKSDVKRAPRSAYNRDSFSAEDQAYACKERGLECPLDHVEAARFSRDFDSELHCVQMATWRIMLDQESEVAGIINSTTTRTVGNGLRTDVAKNWNTDATADVILDVQNAKESVRSRTGITPSEMALIISAGTLPGLMTNDGLRDALKFTRTATIPEMLAAMAALLGVARILVGQAIENTADEGQDFVGADIWATGFASVAVLCPEGSPLSMPCLGRTMLWVSDSPEAIMVEEYDEPQTRSTVFRVRHHTDELEIDANFSQLLDIAA